MKKKLQRFIASLNIFIFLTGVFLPLTSLTYAAEELIPYKYWGISIDAKLTVTPPGIMELIPGRNLQPTSGTNFFDTNLFGVTLDGILTSDASIPKEYELTDNSILTYEEFFDQARNGIITKLENKNISAWQADRSLFTVGAYADESTGLPFTINRQKDDKSFYVDIHIPSKDEMILAPYTNRNGTSDGSDRRYDTTITFVLRAKHEKFDETTGEWDIDSNVKADLSMSEYSPAVWNYKSFDNNLYTEYAVVMDASRSTSARPRVTYTYDAGVDGDYFGEETSSNNRINYYADIYPDEIKGKVYQNGTFKVNGAVYVEDDRGVGEYDYANTNVGYRIENPSPTALSNIKDKGTSSSQYLYAERPVAITDISTDPENELMDISYRLLSGSKEIAKWELTKDNLNNPFRTKNESFDSTYITSMVLDPEARTNEIVFAQKGTYTLEQKVGDVRNHDIVAQAFGTRTYTINVRPAAAPPVADFEYRLHGKPTDFTYPNVPVALLDKSTDINNDIVAWEWTRYDNSKAHTQEGVTATFPAEGIYETELKVTDFLGLSDSIKKPIEVLPPIPKAEITTNEAESLMKENRRIVLSAEESFEPPGDPIQWEKTKWSISPLDGQSPSSIKKDSTSTDKRQVVLFKETGRYKVNLELNNNFTASNPDHPRIDIRKAELIITIIEDQDPVPQFTITGNSPNFKDNPKDTVAKVINTSLSEDSDYLDVFPTPKDDNDYFGRGENAFLVEIRKDSNEDGVFDDSEVYGEFSGREISIPVDFKENEGTDYRATLTVKETFGQPTLKNHVTDSDRRSKTIVHDFVINWIPDIVFDLPEWAYPDDTLSLSTTIKDERVDTTTVVWALEKQDTTGAYQAVDIKDNDIAINGLNKFGGNIQLLQSGFYKLIATVTDEKGQSSSYFEEIRIYPLPNAVLTDFYAWDNTNNPQAFNAKQNRKYKLSGENSHVNDDYGTGIHPINHDKDYWEIIPLDAQGLSSIRIAQGFYELYSEDSNIFLAKNMPLNHEMLFKLPGQFKVRYQATNSIGKKSNVTEQIIQVHADAPPTIEYRLAEKEYRDPNNDTKASLTAYEIRINSPDMDNISLERVQYRFDSNNDGNFDDETWQNAGSIDKSISANYEITVEKEHVGKYQFEIYAEESYGQETIERFVDRNGADKRTAEVMKDTEVDNIAPLADIGVELDNIKPIEILATFNTEYSTDSSNMESLIKNQLRPQLAENNLGATVNIVPWDKGGVPSDPTDQWDSSSKNYPLNSLGMPGSAKQFFAPQFHAVAVGNSTAKEFNAQFKATYWENKVLDDDYKLYWIINGENVSRTGESHGIIINMNPSPLGNNMYNMLLIHFGYGHNAIQVWKVENYILGQHNPMPELKIVEGYQSPYRGYYNINNDPNRPVSSNDLYEGLVYTSPINPSFKATLLHAENGSMSYMTRIHAYLIKSESKISFGFGTINPLWIYTEIKYSTNYTLDIDDTENSGFVGYYQYWNPLSSGRGFQLRYNEFPKNDYSELISNYKWSSDTSTKVLLNFDETAESISQTDELRLGMNLLNNNIKYIGIGSTSAKALTESLIKINNNMGMFIPHNASNSATVLTTIVNYIKSLFPASQKLAQYLILNEQIKYDINYSDYENDPKMDIDDFKYQHDENWFENSLGKIDNENIWMGKGITTFTKVGKFIVEYRTKDNPVGSDDRFDNYRKWSSMPSGPSTLYVHRKPIADFRFNINKNGANMTVTAQTEGYDLDHQSLQNKGIISKEWYYREVSSPTWLSGGSGETFAFTGETTKDYFIKHRVQDMDGENDIGVWSDDNIILVTSKPFPPIANFDIIPQIYPLYDEDFDIRDRSYDPNGDLIVEYRWALKKGTTTHLTKTITNGSGVTQAQIDSFASEVRNKVNSLGNAALGIWTVELQIRDNTGAWGDPFATSDVRIKTFEVVPNNRPPVVSINPTNVFIDGRNDFDKDNLTNPLNQFIDWKSIVTDPDTDNRGFIYRWELTHNESSNGTLRGSNEQSSSDTKTTRVYTTALPFSNQTFATNNLKPGPYDVRLEVTDIPLYGTAKTTAATSKFYVVPEITATPYIISEKDEIIVGDTLLLRVVTDKITTKITAEMLGTEVELQYKRSEDTNDIWEAEIIVPEIDNDAEVDVNFLVETDYGSYDVFGQDGQTTRIKTMTEKVNVIALKLEDFRVVDMVKHAEYKGKYPLRHPDFLLNYIAGYYVTFRIDSKGNPDDVFADVSIDGDTPQKIELKKVDANVWEGKYFALYDTPKDSIISFNLEATKSSSFFNYNDKNSWDGETLIVVDTLLKDAKIQRTN